MTRNIIFPLVAAAALAGCNNSDHTIVAGGPDEGNTAAVPQNVTLPPSIAASKSYRCKDNKIVYVDWMSDGTAHVKETKEAAATPPAEGDLTGDPQSAAITYKGQSCKA